MSICPEGEQQAFLHERARDDLLFDPLPPSKWIKVADDGIRISVRYSERLSHLLRSLPGAQWLSSDRAWRFPFTSQRAIRSALPDIERLAASCVQDPQEEDVQHAAARKRDAEYRKNVVLRNEQDRVRCSGRPCSLRAEFLVPTANTSCVPLALEIIGDRSDQIMGRHASPWVAQILGSDGRSGFSRVFLGAHNDYTRANSKGTRGVCRQYNLDHGLIYQVHERLSWKQSSTYFVRVIDKKIVRMDAEEVWACVAS